MRPSTILAAALAFLAGSAATATATETVKVGEINSYSAIPAFTLPYKKGWEMAVEEINAAGGVLDGRPLDVISRDDGGRPGDAITAANALVAREGVALLAGTFLSNVGLAVSDFAAQRNVPFVAAEPLSDALTWEKGNTQTFRLRPSTYMQAAMLAEEAAKLDATRWATIAPNYEYGQSAVKHFKALLKEKRPDVEFVAEQWPALFKLEAGPTVQALKNAEPDAIFNVTFASDLAKFVREGEARGLFEDRPVVSLLTGEPEYLEPLGAEAPEGWIVTGYPVADIDTPAHRTFVADYTERFGEAPMMGSLVGYNTFKAIAAAIDRAGSLEPDALIRAFEGLTFDTPIGRLEFRESDHQATMGAWVGRTTVRDGTPMMTDWRYIPGEAVLPPPETVRAWRPE